MADAPQGIIRFNGIQSIFTAQFVLSTGISPSTCTLHVAPGQLTLRRGVLEVSYGGERRQWSDCIVDRIDADVDDSGYTTWRITILDRRWKWKQTGKISGYYNARHAVADFSRDKNAKTPTQLIELCLKAMGEKKYKLVGVPNSIWPEVSWDYESPAEALAKLCEDLHLTIALDTRDMLVIQPTGYGPRLPRLPSLESWTETLDPPERPDSLVIVGAYDRYNGWWKLEPVAEDPAKGGAIVPLDEVSYKPAGGWKDVDISNLHDVVEKYRGLAQRDVYRKFRIKPPLKLPGVKEPIEKLGRVLPIDEEQIVRVDSAGQKRTKIAEVGGVYYNGLDDYGVWYEDRVNPQQMTYQAVLGDKFDIDAESGIVTFSEPMYVLAVGSPRSDLGGIFAPDLWIKCGLSLRDAKTFGWSRYEYKKDLPGDKLGTQPRYVIREELIREVYEQLDENGRPTQKDNKAELDTEAKKIWEQLAAEYDVEAPVSASYLGFVAIDPSGAVPSVAWTIDAAGVATTRASWNQEDFTLPTIPRRESRMNEKAREANRLKTVLRAERERLRRAKL